MNINDKIGRIAIDDVRNSMRIDNEKSTGYINKIDEIYLIEAGEIDKELNYVNTLINGKKQI